MGWRRTRVEKDTRTVVVLVGQEPKQKDENLLADKGWKKNPREYTSPYIQLSFCSLWRKRDRFVFITLKSLFFLLIN